MCTTNVYSYVHSDGRKETIEQPSLCPNSRRGKPCSDNVVFQLPSQFVGAASAPAGTSYMGSHLPPTPTYTPRSSTPNYRSGDESDRSYHSGSSSRSKKRSSGIYVSVNGQPVVDMNRRERRSNERIVLVDGPPTPRTPPQTYTGPRTAPPSPSVPFIVDAPAPRDSYSRRPVIVDERRPRVTIELVDPATTSRHARHSSTSSHDSRHSRRSSYTDEEERQQRRERRKEERRREEQEIREQKIRARIDRANREIANRPAAPMPPAPPRRSATFTRPAVEINDRDQAELAEAVRRLRIEKEARRAAEEVEREEEAQRRRLLERIQPKRRATVGPGSRRTRVLYEDGVYRME